MYMREMLNHEGGNRTLQTFFQPPPLSSTGLGGFHFHDHSKDMEELPPVA